MDQLVGFLLHPPLSEIGKKIGKMLKYTHPPLSKYFWHRCPSPCPNLCPFPLDPLPLSWEHLLWMTPN